MFVCVCVRVCVCMIVCACLSLFLSLYGCVQQQGSKQNAQLPGDLRVALLGQL